MSKIPLATEEETVRINHRSALSDLESVRLNLQEIEDFGFACGKARHARNPAMCGRFHRRVKNCFDVIVGEMENLCKSEAFFRERAADGRSLAWEDAHKKVLSYYEKAGEHENSAQFLVEMSDADYLACLKHEVEYPHHSEETKDFWRGQVRKFQEEQRCGS